MFCQGLFRTTWRRTSRRSVGALIPVKNTGVAVTGAGPPLRSDYQPVSRASKQKNLVASARITLRTQEDLNGACVCMRAFREGVCRLPEGPPDSHATHTTHTTHWGAGLCGEQTAIVTAVTGQAAIVQLPLWDWLKQAGPPFDPNTHTQTHTHGVLGISNIAFPWRFHPWTWHVGVLHTHRLSHAAERGNVKDEECGWRSE